MGKKKNSKHRKVWKKPNIKIMNKISLATQSSQCTATTDACEVISG